MQLTDYAIIFTEGYENRNGRKAARFMQKANYSQEQVSDMLDISRHVEAVIMMMCCGKEKKKQW